MALVSGVSCSMSPRNLRTRPYCAVSGVTGSSCVTSSTSRVRLPASTTRDGSMPASAGSFTL